MPTNKNQKLWLPDTEVAVRYGVTRVTIWRWARDSESFPKPRKLGANTARWYLPELNDYDHLMLNENVA